MLILGRGVAATLAKGYVDLEEWPPLFQRGMLILGRGVAATLAKGYFNGE